MAKREPMMLVPQKLELTTQQAAALLNVSRPFVINEIEAGRLKCRLITGTAASRSKSSCATRTRRSSDRPALSNDRTTSPRRWARNCEWRGSAQYTEVLDANVLNPALLRDVLLSLADADLYSAKWSVHLREKWTRSLLRDRHGMGAQIAAAAQAMEDAIRIASSPATNT
ncbi:MULTISPECIES: hypothetical protein [Variovorax]|uniref:hypothetical protein n=1 Tax=Variovorax TaxID=34072 RepID=UPI00285D7E85|nr:hypothetical protein [Variovorax sp. 3319]MDR6890656.1 hypothetical protein [Variovorax sp. 3319]